MSEDFARTGAERFQSRLPASLYEVAWQYSLYDWYSAVQSEDIDWDLAPEHLAYLTPNAQSDLFGEEDSLITVYVDLSDPDNPQLRPPSAGGPIEIGTYTQSDRFRVGHSYPANKTSSMTDYSITTQKSADAHHLAGYRDDAWGTNNVQDRFTEWAQSDHAEAPRQAASETDETILEGLAALGDDSDAMETLGEAFIQEAGGEEEEFESLITVSVRTPDADEYRYPGEIPILNEVMVEKKSARLESISVEDASDQGTGYVSGESEAVTGGSPGLFGMYGKKQREHFPDIDTKGQSAWRTRPLSFDVAAAVSAADSIFEDFYRGLGNNRRLYILPYLAARDSDLDGETFEWFHRTVFSTLRDAETGENGTFDEEVASLIANATNTDDVPDEASFTVETSEDWGRVRFAVVLQVTGNPDRVFFDTLDGGYPPVELEDAHNRVTRSPVFEGDGIFATYPSAESSPLLGLDLRLARLVLYGYYFGRTTEPTRTSRQASEPPSVGDIDDHEMRRVRALLKDESIPLQPLLEEYVHQLVQDQNEEFESDEDYIAFPRRSVVEQYTQLRALAEAGVLKTTNTCFDFTNNSTMSDSPESQEARLETFLDDHDALDSPRDRAVFLLGGLVGRVTAYQSREDVSSTLVRRYPVDYLTKQTVKEVTKEVMQMDNSYAEAEENRSYWTNSRYSTRLADTMLSADPSDWPMSDAELQWLYSLGIAYGLNDTSMEEKTDDAEESAATADD